MSAGLTILNVDDQDIPRYTITRILRRYGFSVTEATSGEEALRLIKLKHPHLVLLDVNLPDIDGLEVCRRIKSDPETAVIPVLHISSTFCDMESRLKGLQNGADGYLIGSEDPELIAATIRSLLRAREGEHALRERDERYRTLLDTVPSLAWMADAQGGLFYANQRLLEYTGLTFDEVRQGWLRDVVHAEDLARGEEGRRRALATGSAWSCEQRLLSRDGSYRWHVTRGMPVRNETGAAGTWVFTSTDIHERKQAEEDLRRSEERLRLMIDGIREYGIYMLDTGGRVLSWNTGGQRITGYAPEEILGRHFSCFYPPEDVARGKPGYCLGQAAEHGTYEEEGWRVRKDGSRFYADVLVTALRDEAGNLRGFAKVTRDIAERRRAEDILGENEPRLRALFNQALGFIAILTPEGTVIDVNQTVLEAGGYRRAEVLGKPFWEVPYWNRSPEVQRLVREHVEEAAQGRPARCESVYFTSDGGRRYVDRSIAPVRDRSGKVVFLIAEGRDITEIRKAQAELQRSRERLDEILNRISDAFYALDREWRYVYVNPRALAMLGRSSAELIGKTVWNVFPELLGSGFERELRRAASEQTPVQFEFCFEPEQRWYDVGVYPSGEGVTLFARDITERKRAEETSRDRENRYRYHIEAAGIGTWEWDMRTNEVRWSDNMEAVHGQAPGSFQGNFDSFLAGVHADDRQPVLDSIERAASSGEYALEYRGLTAGGEPKWLEAKGRVIYGADGHPVRMMGVCMDITERKVLEERLRAAAKLESIGALAGGVAHDFNNLLVGILGNASLALEDLPPSSPVRPLIEGVVAASERAAHLTRQMLAYSGQGRFVIERVDFSELVRSMFVLLHSSVPRNIELRLNLERGLPPVAADAVQMQELVMSLVLNASEAIDRNAGVITISTGVQQVDLAYVRTSPLTGEVEPGSYVALEVRDTGCGMDEAVRARIFDPFFSTKFTGRGLGLAAVLGIVRGHKGGIEVRSAPAQGSTFRILLPAAHAEAAGRTREPAAGCESDGHATVLVVDDEEVVRSSAQVVLERRGYHVLLAEDGRAAIETFRSRADEIALVLLDMSMPGLSGEQTLQELKAIRPAVRVIVSTGYSEGEAHQRFRGQQLAGFLQKPYTASQLAEKIAQSIPKAGAAGRKLAP